MMRKFRCRVVLCVLLGGAAGAQTVAPVACGKAPVVARDSQPNIFSEQQEEWLGEAMADLIEGDVKPVKDPSQNAFVQRIADRLVATLPPSAIRYRVVLVDGSEVNGFSIAGGHIYLTRKLAASAISEDEIAAVIGHEIGHIASHQFAFETTSDLKRLLNVTKLGDRADVYAKFQALTTARLSDKHPIAGDSDTKQDEADRIGVYATAAAGYRPQAAGEFWNRVFFVGGKTRGKLADFFGITKPNEKRLRLMQAMAVALPPGCGGTYTANAHTFNVWRAAVTANQAAESAVELAGATHVKLSPALRMDLDRLRFSPDGKTLLAQDASSIFAISTEPAEPMFRFDAENALFADFSPDSKKIVFTTPGMHTEEWSVGEKKLLAAHEPISSHACLQTKLSPDGRTLICVSYRDGEYTLDLSLIDVEDGKIVFEKKDFFAPTYLFFLQLAYAHALGRPTEQVPYSLSPDGNLLLVGPSDAKLAFDLRTRTPIKVGGELKNAWVSTYAFVGNDRVAIVNASNVKNSGIVSFPDGRMLNKMALNFARMEGTASQSGSRVLVRSTKSIEVAIADLEAGMMILRTKSVAVDERGGRVAVENTDGSVTMTRIAEGKTVDTQRVTLPLGPLSRSRSISLSPDGRYLTASSRTRGAVWDTKTGQRKFLLKGFRDASWNADGRMFAEFKKQEAFAKPQTEAEAKKEAQDKKEAEKKKGKDSTEKKETEEDESDFFVAQVSPEKGSTMRLSYRLEDKMRVSYGLLMEWKAQGKNGSQLVVHHLEDGSTWWTKDFPDGAPRFTRSFGDRDLIFNYPVKFAAVKARLKTDSKLANEAVGMKDKDLGRLVEIVNDSTGKTEAEMVLELPLNFDGTDGLNRAGDQLYVTGADNRTMVYSLTSGKEVRQIFGRVAAVDPVSQRVCAVNRRDEAVVYDATGKELSHSHVGAALVFAHFREKGSQLVMLTSDQTLWTVNVDEGAKAN